MTKAQKNKLQRRIFIGSVGLIISFTLNVTNLAAAPVAGEYGSSAIGDGFAVPLLAGAAAGSQAGCSGAILTPQIIATAAHCIEPIKQRSVEIWVGAPGSIPPHPRREKVIAIFMPANLIRAENIYVNDIAFLVLENPLVEKVNHRWASLDEIATARMSSATVRHTGYFPTSPSPLPAGVQRDSKDFDSPRTVKSTLTPYLSQQERFFNMDPIRDGYLSSIIPECGSAFGSGSPAMIEVGGIEVIASIGSSSNGFPCPKPINSDSHQYRSIVIAHFESLLNQAQAKVLEVSTTKPAPLPAASATAIKKATKSVKLVKITCQRGNVKQVVIAKKPKCPAGSKKVK